MAIGYCSLAKYPDGLIAVHGWYAKKENRDNEQVRHARSYPQYEWRPYQAVSYLEAIAFANKYNLARVEAANAHQFHIIEKGRYPIEGKRVRLIGVFNDQVERDKVLSDRKLAEPNVQFAPLNKPGFTGAANWVNDYNLKLALK